MQKSESPSLGQASCESLREIVQVRTCFWEGFGLPAPISPYRQD
jgi:hypothetical protein